MRSKLAIVLAMMAVCAPLGAKAATIFVPIVIPIPVQVPPASTGGYDRFHTVVIVSAIGTTLRLQNDHFLGPKTGTLSIDDWTIDRRVAAELRKYLAGRFAFKDVTFDPLSLAAIPNGPMNNSSSALRKYLAKLDNTGVDAFIVVRPDLEYQAPGLEGLALENGNGVPVMWANYEIDIVDAHNLDIVAKSYSRATTRAGVPATFAGLLTDGRLKLDDNLAPTEEQKAGLRIAANKIVEVSIIETLRSLQLGINLPEPGARTLVAIDPQKMPYPNVKSVAVVSMLGDTLDLEYMATVFDRNSGVLPVPDWQIDSSIEETARAELSHRFIVKDVAVDRAALAGAQIWDRKGQLSPSFPGLPATADVDAYVVFVKLPVAVPGTEHGWADTTAAGPGIWDNAMQHTAIFAHYAVALVDASTLKLISAREAISSPDYAMISPYEVVDDSLWPGIPPKPAPGKLDKIHDLMRGLLTDSTKETLLALGLTGFTVDTSSDPDVASAPPTPGTN